ncbi:MAG TPA: S41 family peptidase, partial [Candidatus Saccharimonadales bacterium]|nr:S41 family peptidase [Candidatus Saccharimonadales bacterium]
DGKWLAFASNRRGNYDVYVMPAEGGLPRQLTWHSADDIPCCFTPDGQQVIFTSAREGTYALFSIPVAGGMPRRLTRTFWSDACNAAVSPDGRTVLLNLNDQSLRFWWRVGYRGSNSADVWALDLAAGKYSRWTTWQGDDNWPQWGPDGKAIYYVSDREGRIPNLYVQEGGGGTPRALTRFADDPVRFLSVSRDGSRAAYEHAFGIWVTDLPGGESREVKIYAGADFERPLEETRAFSREASEMALAPDSRKIALVVRGDLFVLPADGGETRHVTSGPERDKQVTWTPDARSLVYVSDPTGVGQVYVTPAAGGAPRRLTDGPGEKGSPTVSPDGRWVVYFKDFQSICATPLAGGPERTLVPGPVGNEELDCQLAVSPDSRWLAYTAVTPLEEHEIWLIPLEGGTPVNVTRANHESLQPAWSRDGKCLFFASNRKGHDRGVSHEGNFEIYRLPLLPDTVKFAESKLDSLFLPEPPKKEAGGSPPAVRVDFTRIERRARRLLETSGDCLEPTPSPDGRTLVFLGSDFNGSQVYSLPAEGGKARALTSGEPVASPLHESGTFTRPGVMQWDKDGKKLFYLAGGQIRVLTLGEGGGATGPAEVAYSAQVAINTPGEYRQMFHEAWTTLRDYYYDAGHHGADWEAVGRKYEERAGYVAHHVDFEDQMREMMGELNSSHTGAYGPPQAPEEPTAGLGCEFDAPEPGQVGARIRTVYREGPLDQPNVKVAPGEYLLAVDGRPLTAGARDDAWLSDQVGKRVRLLVASAPVAEGAFQGPATPGAREVRVKGLSPGEQRTLRYNDWDEGRRDYVRRRTADRLLYIHLPACGAADLEKFRRELQAGMDGHQGLLLDLRWNTGGSLDEPLLMDLWQRPYQYRGPRGFPRHLTPAFAWTRPTAMLVNEQSLSNAEVTANGFQQLGLGPVVGRTTYGWLIGTGSRRLLDGSSYRLPYRGCWTLKGEDTETWGGVKPDVDVESTPEDDSGAGDPQLDKAIEVLEARLPK